MRSSLRALLLLFTTILLIPTPQATAQAPLTTLPPENITPSLTFERSGHPRGGWGGGPAATMTLDSTIFRSGRASGRIDRDAGSPNDFSTFTLVLPRYASGSEIVLRGWLRTENVSEWGGLWLRQDAGTLQSVQFDNMQNRGPRGTTEWTEYRISLPLDPRTRGIAFGALMGGTGTMWVDDLQLLVDGVPIWEAPLFAGTVTPPELDHEFDSGSDITLTSPTALQVESLALLGKVWGFVKYHHPRVTGGEVNWDYDLMRGLPAILAVESGEAARRGILVWLEEQLGTPPPCVRCAQPPVDPHLPAEIGWIRDRAVLGDELSAWLTLVYDRRPVLEEQYYVSKTQGVGNGDFSREQFHNATLPDPGFRLLALYRYWNIIEYWFPYRDLIDANWDAVLTEFVPRIMAVGSRVEYGHLLNELSARIDDTHASAGGINARPPVGTAYIPVALRFVEEKPIVVAHLRPAPGALQIGDVITRIGGVPVDSLVASLAPYYSASNRPALLRKLERELTRGEVGPVEVEVDRAGARLTMFVERLPSTDVPALRVARWNDLPGEAFQMLSDDVAYLKLSRVVAADVRDHVEQARNASVFVVDIRNYPSEVVPFALGGHFVRTWTPFARFTSGDLSNPGAFLWGPTVSLEPLQPYFQGKVVVLVDESTLSQAEYTAMALRASPNTIVVGSTTSAADGNVSQITQPGGFRAVMTGLGVFYPDGTPTQQVGIVPDLVVRPTIAGVRAGRDEVLEAGVSHALGREFRLR